MDTLTHALSGALLARATEPKAATVPRRTRMVVTFWAAAFPDSDFVLRFIDPLTYLTAHRGITHSVIMLPVWATVLALLFQFLYRRRYPWRAFFVACALGIGIHIAGDVITSFGTMIFAPVSEWRAQLPVTFIIDPYFTLIIVAGLLASLRWPRTRTAAAAGLFLLFSYVGAQTVLHYRAKAFAEEFIAANRLTQATAYALPQPFSPFNWLAVVEQPERYHMSYISLARRHVRIAPPGAGLLRRVYDSYRPIENAQWRMISRYGESSDDIAVAKALWQSEVMARYRRFAMFPAVYGVERSTERACVRFTDLRFALSGRKPPFRYAACREAGSSDWAMYYVSDGDGGTELLHAIE